MAEEKKEVIATKEQRNELTAASARATQYYLDQVSIMNANAGTPMTEESKRCGMNAIIYLCNTLGVDSLKNINQAQIIQVLQFVTLNGLDVLSGQVFIDTRKDRYGHTTLRAVPMGNAYEIMVKRFGVDVKAVHQAWVIHDGDEFHLPEYDGLKITPAKFKPTLKGMSGKAIAVCYPIEKTNGDAEYVVSTREEVARNLMAQILNATLKRSDVNRQELMSEMDGKTLDELLSDPKLAEFISPTYRSPSSRESMIVAKMKKNALLHYTRDIGGRTFQGAEGIVDDNSDMIAKNVVAEATDNVSQSAETPSKIKDFDVDDFGEVEDEKKPEAENKPVESEKPSDKESAKPIEQSAPKATETPENGKPAESPKEEEPRQSEIELYNYDDIDDVVDDSTGDVFDTKDL